MSTVLMIKGAKCKGCGSKDDVFIVRQGREHVKLCADCRRGLFRTLEDHAIEQFLDKMKAERGCN